MKAVRYRKKFLLQALGTMLFDIFHNLEVSIGTTVVPIRSGNRTTVVPIRSGIHTTVLRDVITIRTLTKYSKHCACDEADV